MKINIFKFLIIFNLPNLLFSNNWEYIKGPSNQTTISALDVYNGTIYISLYEKLLKTEDFGITWKEIRYNNKSSFNWINQILVNKSKIFVRSPQRSRGSFFEFVVSDKDESKWSEINNEYLPINYYYCVSKINDMIYATFSAKNKLDTIFPNIWQLKHYDEDNNTWEDFIDSISLKQIRYPKTIYFFKDKFYFGMTIGKYYIDKNIKNTTRIYLYNVGNKTVNTIMDTTTDFWKSHINCFVEKDGVLFLGSSTGVYKSTDEGLTWIRKSEGLHYKDSTWDYDLEIHRMLVHEGFIYAIATPPTSYGDFNPTYTSLVYSKDNGESWQFANKFQSDWPQDFRLIGDRIILSTYLGGLFETDKTLTKKVSLLNDTLNSGNVLDFCVDDNKLIASNYQKFLSMTENNGKNWESMINNPNLANAIITKMFIKDSLYYFSNNSQSFLVSNDYGKTYKLPSEGAGLKNTQVNSIYVDEKNIVYAGTRYGIYYSTNNGETWDKLTPQELDVQILSIEKSGDFLYIGTNDFGLYQFNLIDNKIRQLQIPKKHSEISITEIKTINKKLLIGTKIYANSSKGITVYGEGIFVSSDMGETWEKRNNGLPDSCETINIVSYGDYIFAGMSRYGGVYYTTDEGLNWYPLNKGYSGYTLNRLRVFGDYLYCATSTGLYKLNLKEWINGVEEVERKNYLYNYPPYPNPATNEVSAMIYWDLALDINTADIKIYDIYGKQVADKSSTTLTAEGNYWGKLTWHCKGAPAGVYLIAINYGTEKKTIKVCVVE